MRNPPPTAVVVFAQVPPPDHGQSQMVKMALEALRADPGHFEVHHINARFSETLGDIGETSFRKGFLTGGYLVQAILTRLKVSDPLLYYVPGPAKWSAVIRDWLILSVLRIFYRKVVFHWHAIGQGEWAHGSERVSPGGYPFFDPVARRISAFLLERPYASISVCETSTRDTAAVGARHPSVVCNGIDDPCADYRAGVVPSRMRRFEGFRNGTEDKLRILFLAHGTEDKGLFDAVEAIGVLLDDKSVGSKLEVTFAGGIGGGGEERFESGIDRLKAKAGSRLKVNLLGYQDEEGKSSCFRYHDIFLSASRWESFGLTTVEAMAFGLVVVAVGSDGVKGVLPPDYRYLAAPCDPGGLAGCLARCERDICDGTVTVENCHGLRARFLERYQLKSFSGSLRGALSFQAKEEVVAPGGRLPGLVAGRAGRIGLQVYLADQNPGYDRSFGISRMSKIMVEALGETDRFEITTLVSETSQKAPGESVSVRKIPWGTRSKIVRFLTDHLHPLLFIWGGKPVIHYFPKGYLPFLSRLCTPSVITIHDTIIQYDEDHYPEWRSSWEYRYWALMLKHTLRKADCILTVSESSREQIRAFMNRHHLPVKDITVTYEPCAFEGIPQATGPLKKNFVIHLASVEPHKRTLQLVRWWISAYEDGLELPELHLIGSPAATVVAEMEKCPRVLKTPFLTDLELQRAYREAKALILPSEIEGFGLPALEAYFLGTPVCFVRGTSVEEILSVATCKGGMDLDNRSSLLAALDEVTAMSAEEIYRNGLILREEYHSDKVSMRMTRVFEDLREKFQLPTAPPSRK